jgi:hypothetical protein
MTKPETHPGHGRLTAPRTTKTGGYFRRGRCTNSPPQLGQTLFISVAHFSQNVHSYEQIMAMPAADNSRLHFSHAAFICNAMNRSPSECEY